MPRGSAARRTGGVLSQGFPTEVCCVPRGSAARRTGGVLSQGFPTEFCCSCTAVASELTHLSCCLAGPCCCGSAKPRLPLAAAMAVRASLRACALAGSTGPAMAVRARLPCLTHTCTMPAHVRAQTAAELPAEAMGVQQSRRSLERSALSAALKATDPTGAPAAEAPPTPR